MAGEINKVICGASGQLGTGTKGCIIDMENLTGFGLLKQGTRITDFTRAGFRALQKEGKLHVIQDIFDATWSNEDLQTEASPSRRLKSQTSASLYEFTAMMDKGSYYQKVLESLKGKWDVILFDEAENIFGTSRDDSYMKGFYANVMLHAYTPKQGTTEAKSQVTIQLQRSIEFDKYNSVVTSEVLDFSIPEIDGVNQVQLSVVSGMVSASTTIKLKAVLAIDKNTFIDVDGLTLDKILLKINGATVTPSGITSSPTEGTYDLALTTALSTDDKVEIVLYNSTDNQRVIEVGTAPDEVLYKSKEVVEVVAAA